LPNGATTTPATPTAPSSIAPLTDTFVTVPITLTPVSGEESERADVATTVLSPNERLQQLINEADWIIFAMLDVDPTQNLASEVVKEFLRQQSERLSEKRIIVVALNAPYFLDATEISKLSAYIGAYSKTQPFLESAVRALFRSYTPTGAPAVSVPGTRFGNLTQRVSPAPDFVLPLSVTVDDQPIDFAANNDNKVPVVPVGTVLRLQVDQVLDHNGHPVPDGVPINFHLVYENPEMTIPIAPVLTRNGSGAREVTLEQAGRLMISASAGEAATAGPLALRVQDPFAEATANAVTANAESNTPTPTASAVPLSPTLSTALSDTMPAIDGVTPLESSLLTRNWVSWDTLIIALITIMVTLSLLLILQIHILPRSILVHNMLWALICGLGAYILFALGILPGTFFLISKLQVWSAAVVVFIGMLLPLLWLQLRAE
jgi:beta-N-acetylhexosaminidase